MWLREDVAFILVHPMTRFSKPQFRSSTASSKLRTTYSCRHNRGDHQVSVPRPTPTRQHCQHDTTNVEALNVEAVLWILTDGQVLRSARVRLVRVGCKQVLRSHTHHAARRRVTTCTGTSTSC